MVMMAVADNNTGARFCWDSLSLSPKQTERIRRSTRAHRLILLLWVESISVSSTHPSNFSPHFHIFFPFSPLLDWHYLPAACSSPLSFAAAAAPAAHFLFGYLLLVFFLASSFPPTTMHSPAICQFGIVSSGGGWNFSFFFTVFFYRLGFIFEFGFCWLTLLCPGAGHCGFSVFSHFFVFVFFCCLSLSLSRRSLPPHLVVVFEWLNSSSSISLPLFCLHTLFLPIIASPLSIFFFVVGIWFFWPSFSILCIPSFSFSSTF